MGQGVTCNHCGGAKVVIVNGREVTCPACHGTGETGRTK